MTIYGESLKDKSFRPDPERLLDHPPSMSNPGDAEDKMKPAEVLNRRCSPSDNDSEDRPALEPRRNVARGDQLREQCGHPGLILIPIPGHEVKM